MYLSRLKIYIFKIGLVMYLHDQQKDLVANVMIGFDSISGKCSCYCFDRMFSWEILHIDTFFFEIVSINIGKKIPISKEEMGIHATVLKVCTGNLQLTFRSQSQ